MRASSNAPPARAMRSAAARLLPLALCAALWTLAQPALDRVQAIALQRYGAGAADTVAGWRRLLGESRALGEDERVKAVNAFFNRRIRYVSDRDNWGATEYWATPLETMGRGQGDCEDYAIAKYFSLLLLGVPNEKLRLIYVRARFGGPASGNSEAHMVLGYYADPAGEPLILDSLVASIRPASARGDLAPVFSFNTQGLWVSGAQASDSTTRLSRWRDLLERTRAEGLAP